LNHLGDGAEADLVAAPRRSREAVVAAREAVRHRWFVKGATALVAAAGGDGRSYRCPCCLRDFDVGSLGRNGLSDEHVPPRSMGGKELVLNVSAVQQHGRHRARRPTAARSVTTGFLASG
jgi:hypothetical protein